MMKTTGERFTVVSDKETKRFTIVSDEQTNLGCCLFFHVGRASRAKAKAADAARKEERSDSLREYAVATTPIKEIKGVREFSLADLKLATDNFSSENNLVDSKSFDGLCRVYKGVLPSGELLRVRKSLVAFTDARRAKQFEAEIELLSRMHHRNLVSFIGYCNERGEHLLVYEHLADRSLRDHLGDHQGSPVSWDKRLEIAVGTSRGVAHMHQLANPPIIHRNINSANILLSDKQVPKVAELGLAMQMTDKRDYVDDPEGGYMAPEFSTVRKSTDKSDVYAIGVVLLELLTSQKAYDLERKANDENALLADVMRSAFNQGGWAAVEKQLDPVLVDLPQSDLEPFLQVALLCTETDPAVRPSMESVVETLESLMLVRIPHPKSVPKSKLSKRGNK